MKIQVLQSAVARMVEDIGEPWRPASAHAHLVSRVGVPDPLGVLVAALTIANRYGLVLNQSFQDAGITIDDEFRGLPTADLRPELAQALRPVARTLDFYDSADALQGSDPYIVSLHVSLPRLITAALRAFPSADTLNDRLTEYLAAFTEPAAARAFDPATAEAVALMRPIQRATYCPFAQRSVLWGAPTYDPARSFTENMAASLPTVRAFTRAQDREYLDGYVYAFPVSEFGGTLDDTAAVLRRLVEYLCRTLTQSGSFDPKAAASPDWFLVLESEETFISVFSPCYPHTNSRYSHGVDTHILMMLQPEAAVLRQLNRRDYHPRSTAIRDRFAEHLQPYVLADTEAERFLLPVRAGDPHLPWYDLDLPDVDRY
ncbi:hypothetical protein [Actinokineospora inagensis]|uniref:hypothetical protein n=1 Tax=Actinokineospora inagensis TaxID=103730 RepID=UPI00042783A4|nr:hypothetical protein [Actinokineospora inagensis]